MIKETELSWLIRFLLQRLKRQRYEVKLFFEKKSQ